MSVPDGTGTWTLYIKAIATILNAGLFPVFLIYFTYNKVSFHYFALAFHNFMYNIYVIASLPVDTVYLYEVQCFALFAFLNVHCRQLLIPVFYCLLSIITNRRCTYYVKDLSAQEAPESQGSWLPQ